MNKVNQATFISALLFSLLICFGSGAQDSILLDFETFYHMTPSKLVSQSCFEGLHYLLLLQEQKLCSTDRSILMDAFLGKMMRTQHHVHQMLIFNNKEIKESELAHIMALLDKTESYFPSVGLEPEHVTLAHRMLAAMRKSVSAFCIE